MSAASSPVFDEDLFAEEVLVDIGPTYRKIREMGDVVWCPSLDMYLAGRYADVKAGLLASDVLISSRGVSVNADQHGDGIRRGPTGVLTMDGEEHDFIKKLLMKPLTPKGLTAIKAQIEAEARAIVGIFLDGQPFEAMSGMASQLPLRVVSQLVGLANAPGDELLRWASAAFMASGPAGHPRAASALPVLGGFIEFVGQVDKSTVTPGGWAASLFDAMERGEIDEMTARLMVFDYAVPSLDTTILATGELLWQLAINPDAYQALRNDPALIPSAVYEAVRMSTPIRGFTRYVDQDFALSETTLPKGSRIWLLNASANRDERKYANPDVFDVKRNPRDNLAWGYGKHLCAGMNLARLEMESLLGALVRSVETIELVGNATKLVNNGLQGFERFQLTLRAGPMFDHICTS